MYKKLATLGIIGATAALAGCAPPPVRPNSDTTLQRDAIAGTHEPVPPPLSTGTAQTRPLSPAAAPETRYGTGVFINPAPTRGAARTGTNQGGTITFNFDNQPVQAAVKAILGDVLHTNYAISPDVKGTVTFATSQPVTEAEVLPILQMLLSWTGNAVVRQDGRYLVVPVDQAAPGNLVPGLGAVSPGAGYAAQLFPLHYVSAGAMRKLLKPFAGPKAFLLVDPVRNLLVMGGTPDELANYQRIIHTFDVDWLRGMSVAVIPLQHVQAQDLVGQLQTLFSEQGTGTRAPTAGETPAAGQSAAREPLPGNISSMVRLLPLKHSNSLVVITTQPAYLDEVRRLVTTIDNGAGNSSGLYVYNVINVKASDLARHLNELFGNPTTANQRAPAGAVAPGFSPLEQTGFGSPSSGFGNFSQGNTLGGASGGGEMGDQTMGGSAGFDTGALGSATQARRQQAQQQGAASFTTSEGVRIAAVNENNQLLIRATPGQWEKLLPVIRRLDEKPLQVQIETKVLEVDLTGQFQFGVQWFLNGLVGTQPGSPPNTDASYFRHQGALGGGGVQYSSTDALFYSFTGSKLQFAVSAMEQSGEAKVLSAPSAVVLNNREATFKVGEQIPVVQTAIIPGLGTTATATATSVNAASVSYINTGVLLDVVPRVNPGGLVYMDIQQVVSSPQGQPDQYGNYTISNRSLSTEVAVQSGQTVLLGGLIQESDSNTDTGIPFLNRIPIFGRLFGTTSRSKTRTELIVLITPTVVRNPEDARQVTDEYETQFESLRPILPKTGPAPAAGEPAPTPAPATARPTPAVTEPAKDARATVPSGDWTVQVASFTHREDAEQLSGRLRQLGFASYVDNAQTAHGPFWRVRGGPVVDRDAAERLRSAISDALHIQGMLVVRQ